MSDVSGLPWEILPGLLLALLLITVVTPGIDAVGTIGLVLCEALVLYVAYGAVIRTAQPTVHAFLVRA